MQVLVTYDKEADAGYIAFVRIKDGEAKRQEAVSFPGHGEVVLDFDDAGRLLGLEVIGARSLLRPEVIAAAVPAGRGHANW